MRTREQVVASAADMQACIDAGLPWDLLVALVSARQDWRSGAAIDVTQELVDAVNHPGAARFDHVFVAAARREIRRWR